MQPFNTYHRLRHIKKLVEFEKFKYRSRTVNQWKRRENSETDAQLCEDILVDKACYVVALT